MRALGKARRIGKTPPNTPLLIANLASKGPTDLVLGSRILWECNPRKTSEWQELETSLPGSLVAGDVNRHGRDDLVRFMRVVHNPDPYTENDVFLHTTYRESDPDWDFDGLANEEEVGLGTDPRNRDTDKDGLPDGQRRLAGQTIL